MNLGLLERDDQDDEINNDFIFVFVIFCYFFMPALRARCCGDVTPFFSWQCFPHLHFPMGKLRPDVAK